MNSRFGLVLILLLSTVSCSCTAYQHGYQKALTEGNEAHLKDSLSLMREGIKKYTDDTGAPPQSLDELAKAGYITHVPRDMVTNEIDWVIVRYDCSASPNCKKTIGNIHSAAIGKATDGTLYKDW